MLDVPFLPEAREEFLAAVDHYDAASPGLGAEFRSPQEAGARRTARATSALALMTAASLLGRMYGRSGLRGDPTTTMAQAP